MKERGLIQMLLPLGDPPTKSVLCIAMAFLLKLTRHGTMHE